MIYQLLEADTAKEMELKVNQYLVEGWKLRSKGNQKMPLSGIAFENGRKNSPSVELMFKIIRWAKRRI
jgi:phage terminase large subunit GpA-like protein